MIQIINMTLYLILYSRKIPIAQDIWDEIVVAYPTDIFALKMLWNLFWSKGPDQRYRCQSFPTLEKRNAIIWVMILLLIIIYD